MTTYLKTTLALVATVFCLSSTAVQADPMTGPVYNVMIDGFDMAHAAGGDFYGFWYEAAGRSVDGYIGITPSEGSKLIGKTVNFYDYDYDGHADHADILTTGEYNVHLPTYLAD